MSLVRLPASQGTRTESHQGERVQLSISRLPALQFRREAGDGPRDTAAVG